MHRSTWADLAARINRDIQTTSRALGIPRGVFVADGLQRATACREVTGRAMAPLNNAEALIVDLRDNGGGFGDIAPQIAGYLFTEMTIAHCSTTSERSAFRQHPDEAGARTAITSGGTAAANPRGLPTLSPGVAGRGALAYIRKQAGNSIRPC